MALCAGNVWLEADNLGLGGVYLGVYPEEERMANTRAAIDLPEEYDPFCLLAIGYPERPMRPQQNRFDETRIHYIK
jgi:nitroreductase